MWASDDLGNTWQRGDMLTDGMHPGDLGQKFVAELFMNAIREAV